MLPTDGIRARVLHQHAGSLVIEDQSPAEKEPHHDVRRHARVACEGGFIRVVLDVASTCTAKFRGQAKLRRACLQYLRRPWSYSGYYGVVAIATERSDLSLRSVYYSAEV